ncbi:hypothetical protein ACS0TY_010294 [Phlomoides rotata]
MKRGKDEEKIMGPMFPRLHVNDTEKGGPRAPPRNKMALYEQLSIPSQRSSRMVMQCNLSNNVPNSVPPSSQQSVTTSSPSYGGSFTNEKRKILQKEQVGDATPAATPVRRSNRLRNRAAVITSPY